MRQCVVCSEYIDYSDYHPEDIPVQNTNNIRYDSPSPEYKSVMANLCDNWQSPISYLKKRGYMPEDKPIGRLKKQDDDTYRKEMLLKGKNYFFFPENEQQSFKDNSIALDEDKEYNSVGTNTIPPVTDEPKNDTTGIIDKVKKRIFSIFSPKGHDKESASKSETLEPNYDADDSELFDNSNDYELSDRRVFVRSATEKPANLSRSEGEDILSDLSDTDVQYVKSFINCFRKSKQDFQIQPKSGASSTTAKTGADLNPKGAKPSDIKPGAAKPIESSTTPKSISNTTPECVSVDITEAATTQKPSKQQGGSKGTMDDFTVDLDINQKNGTGEESHPPVGCQCIPIVSPMPSDLQKNKYVIKSKFLAHLHHMVDEVGKPPYKPLDLRKIQAVIDQSKNLPTVTMGVGKTTECAPLRLNDMSFDLEWNRIGKSPETNREKLNFLDFPQINQPQGLAVKFLQDVNSYPGNSDEPLKTPYGDNFLDSQRSLPDDLEGPLKISTKRETFAPRSASQSHKFSQLLSDIASLPDPGDDDTPYYMDDDSDDDAKRRVKGRFKSRGRKKPKAKSRGGSSSKSPSSTADVDITPFDFDTSDQSKGNDFNSFDELKDIQFRVNDDDEEAISKFIANLNSPPEVFSFDVDKYLRSAKQDMEPQAPEFEYQSPEPRTYYEFMDAPAVERERIPLGDSQPQAYVPQEDAVMRKRARPSGGKRDLLRQYIKGVSSALNHDFPELSVEYNRANEEKCQRSPNLDTDLSFRTNSLVDGFSTSLDAMNYIKSNDNGDHLDNYFLLNDGGATIDDLAKQEVIPDGRYSPQSLELDLDLNKKFRDLDVGALSGGNRMQHNSAPIDANSVNDQDVVNNSVERRDFETSNEQT